MAFNPASESMVKAHDSEISLSSVTLPEESNSGTNAPSVPGSGLDPNLFSTLDSSPRHDARNDQHFSSLTPLKLDTNFPRAMSDSALSCDTQPFDSNDLSAYPKMPSYSSLYTPESSANLCSTSLSPIPSLRQQQIGVAGGNIRPTVSSSYLNHLSTQVKLDRVHKRWSTGSYAPNSSHITSPLLTHKRHSLSHLRSPSTRINNGINPTRPQPGSKNRAHFQIPLPDTVDKNVQFRQPAPQVPNGVLRTLCSDAEPQRPYLRNHSRLLKPPDLLGHLKEKPAAPPPEDMTPDDPDLVPFEQELRFNNDLYTPRWVRGHGNKREGWCGLCKPGRWLVLKNSAFWYDKSFAHGISAATGQALPGPRDMRLCEHNSNVWEGLCGNCNEWVALVSSKKKGTTWFRHAYKCHNSSNKNAETLKRRREDSPSQDLPSNAKLRRRLSPPAALPKPEPAVSVPQGLGGDTDSSFVNDARAFPTLEDIVLEY